MMSLIKHGGVYQKLYELQFCVVNARPENPVKQASRLFSSKPKPRCGREHFLTQRRGERGGSQSFIPIPTCPNFESRLAWSFRDRLL